MDDGTRSRGRRGWRKHKLGQTKQKKLLRLTRFMFPPPHPSLKEAPPQGVLSYDQTHPKSTHPKPAGKTCSSHVLDSSDNGTRVAPQLSALIFLPPCWRLRLLYRPPFLYLCTMLLLQVKTGFWDTLKASHRLASQMRDKAKLAAVRA